MVKGQDVLVLLKLFAHKGSEMPFHWLAAELDMSPAEVHQATKRAEEVGLLTVIPSGRGHRKLVNKGALEEFLLHALRFICPAIHGPPTRGIPTSFGAPCFPQSITSDEMLPVWPTAAGEVRGLAFSPIYRSAPFAAQRDPALYELLVLVDAIRGGKAREREVAQVELVKRLRHGK